MDSSGMVFEFISAVLAILILHPQKLYLSFYWSVSAHLLTVMYQMMLRRVQEYGSLGVFRELWMVPGQFLNSFYIVLAMLILHPKKQVSQLPLSHSCHLLTVLYHMMLMQVRKYDRLGFIRELWMI